MILGPFGRGSKTCEVLAQGRGGTPHRSNQKPCVEALFEGPQRAKGLIGLAEGFRGGFRWVEDFVATHNSAPSRAL